MLYVRESSRLIGCLDCKEETSRKLETWDEMEVWELVACACCPLILYFSRKDEESDFKEESRPIDF